MSRENHARAGDLTRKRIVILISVFERGGAERQAFLLARELRQRYGLDVQVWALMYSGDYASEFEAAGIPTRVIGFRHPRTIFHWPRRLSPVVRALREGGVDVLLPFTAWPNVVAGLVYRSAGIGLCIWGERHAGGERVPGIERIATRQYRRFVANSSAGVEFLAREMRVARERISFVPNGVEVPAVERRQSWRAELGLDADQLLVVMIANITRLKDHETLLRAWKLVQDRWPMKAKPLLVLAGREGDRYETCWDLVQELGIDLSVRFVGSIPDAHALIEASDIAAFSSLNEGMPNGVLECMAAGKPLIATDLPGVRDALGPGAADCLVHPYAAVEFADKLLSLMSDRDKQRALGAANKARIRTEFSVARMAERHLQIIRASLPQSEGQQHADLAAELRV